MTVTRAIEKHSLTWVNAEKFGSPSVNKAISYAYVRQTTLLRILVICCIAQFIITAVVSIYGSKDYAAIPGVTGGLTLLYTIREFYLTHTIRKKIKTDPIRIDPKKHRYPFLRALLEKDGITIFKKAPEGGFPMSPRRGFDTTHPNKVSIEQPLAALQPQDSSNAIEMIRPRTPSDITALPSGSNAATSTYVNAPTHPDVSMLIPPALDLSLTLNVPLPPNIDG